MRNFYQQPIRDILKQLKTSPAGLGQKEAEKRRRHYGPNQLLSSDKEMTRLKIFLRQWESPLLWILLVAGAVSGWLGEYADMTVILLAAGVNALVGFIQEDKADRALRRLKEMILYYAVVQRDGRKQRILTSEVVPGDLVFLEAGDRVPADGRIVKCEELLVNEAALTGESEPQKKNSRDLKKETPLADRTNSLFAGTIVARGRAELLVVLTGARTEIGQIASLVKKTETEKTPLQLQLSALGKYIGLVILGISLLLFLLGVFSPKVNYHWLEMFKTAVAVAVAAIPEGLVVSLTAILAIGMQTILRRNALVRKLVAAETLGSVTVICADKTGTITEGRMRLTRLVSEREDLNFEEIKLLRAAETERHADALLALRVGVMCNDAVWENPEEAEEDRWRLWGDTTDLAFFHAGLAVGLDKTNLDRAIPRAADLPFNSERKFMATLHHLDHESMIYLKGAPEVILPFCGEFENQGRSKKLTAKKMAWWKNKADELAGEGWRVLALAYKKEASRRQKVDPASLKDMVLVGLTALSDPLRADVKETLVLTKRAGIRTVMITGDHKQTALTIGRQIGLVDGETEVFDGAALEKINEEELRLVVSQANIFARVDPRHKIRIVNALRQNGEVVAMTGDGVNDAPALKGADIGVALGSGTDVAKEISDLVLLDDKFSTIAAAIEQGRTIYDNIKKVVLYLLTNSLAEVIIIASSLLVGLPLPVLPAQILWVNLIEDSFPAIALAFDRGNKKNMLDPPRQKGAALVDGEMKTIIAAVSLISNLILFGLFIYFFQTTADLALARTIVFTALAAICLLYIYSLRDLRQPVWRINPLNNNYLTGAVLLGWLLLVGAIYWPPLQSLLHTSPLQLYHWAVVVAFGLLNVFLIELVKLVFLTKNNHQPYAQ